MTATALHRITGRAWKCGPSALAAITGETTHQAAAVIRRVRADGRPVNGVAPLYMRLAAAVLGVRLDRHPDPDPQARDGQTAPSPSPPTLAAWTRSAPSGLWVLWIGPRRGGHYIALQVPGGRAPVMVADSWNRQPLPLRDPDRRGRWGMRSRVQAAWRVEGSPDMPDMTGFRPATGRKGDPEPADGPESPGNSPRKPQDGPQALQGADSRPQGATGRETGSRGRESASTALQAPSPALQGLAPAIREAGDMALQGADTAARRSGSVPSAVRRLAPSTCRLRGHALRRFADWVAGSPQPSIAAAVDAYAEHLFSSGKSVATVASAVSAIRWWAGAAGVEGARTLGADPIADARRDGDRRRRGRGQAGAVDWDAADKIARRAARDGTPKGLRDAAVIAVASDLCARVSEVAALRVRDLDRGADGTATAEVYQPKTGTARTGYLRASTVRRLDAWCAAAEIDTGDAPLFPAMDRWGNVRDSSRAMQPRAVAEVIRQRAAAVGIRASGHSLRVGAAVSMAARGASLVAMQQAGGWTAPDMPAHYGRQASARKGPVATLRPEDRWA